MVGNSLVGIATLDEASEQLRSLLELPLFVAQTEDFLGPAQDALSRLAHLSDANAAEISAARQAAVQARESVHPAAALFDVLTAAGISAELSTEFAQSGTFWIGNLPSILDSDAPREARNVLAELPPFHFPIAFPEVFLRERPGFDVIIGNPPWEEATVEEDRFWTRHNPGFHSLTQREQEVLTKKLRTDRPDLLTEFESEVTQAALLRAVLLSGPYPGMGTGDPDVYKAACWRFWSLVRPETGRVSVVLPRSAFAAKGSAEFRRTLFSVATMTDVTQLAKQIKLGVSRRASAIHIHPCVMDEARSWTCRQHTVARTVHQLDRFMRGIKLPATLFLVSEVMVLDGLSSIHCYYLPMSLRKFLRNFGGLQGSTSTICRGGRPFPIEN